MGKTWKLNSDLLLHSCGHICQIYVWSREIFVETTLFRHVKACPNTAVPNGPWPLQIYQNDHTKRRFGMSVCRYVRLWRAPTLYTAVRRYPLVLNPTPQPMARREQLSILLNNRILPIEIATAKLSLLWTRSRCSGCYYNYYWLNCLCSVTADVT